MTQSKKSHNSTTQGMVGRTSLTSYLETVKGKKRTPNENAIRVTTAFTPRTTGAGDLKRITQEILKYAQEFDEQILRLPWDNNSEVGPIGLDDLANPHAMHDVIKLYFNNPLCKLATRSSSVRHWTTLFDKFGKI
jgi:hypothetical protein